MTADDVCRSCHAPIRWARTEKGKRMPLDPAPVLGGNRSLEEVPAYQLTPAYFITEAITPHPDRPGYVSHFSTCPHAARHRGRS